MPSRVRRSSAAPRRRGRSAASGAGSGCRSSAAALRNPSQPNLPSATTTRARSRISPARAPGKGGSCRAPPASACWRAARSGRRRRCRRREAQAVVAADRGRLVGEPGAVERRVEPVAGAVAGEHPAGAVGAVGGGGEADDQDPRLRVAEAADRARPVVLAAEALRRVGGLGLAPGDQARAFEAVVDLGGERRQPAARPDSRSYGSTADSWHRTESRGAARRSPCLLIAAILAGCGGGGSSTTAVGDGDDRADSRAVRRRGDPRHGPRPPGSGGRSLRRGRPGSCRRASPAWPPTSAPRNRNTSTRC